MSSGERPPVPSAVTVKDLVEEGKKRIVFLIVCVFGLSYLMSLTSSSVLVNLPAAAVMIIIFRYLSLDFDMRRKAAIYKSKPSSVTAAFQTKPSESSTVIIEKSNWRQKVNSPIVEEAIDHFSRHIVSEWVTDMWYSRITPDRQGPEELVQIMNSVTGEIAYRMRNINLIDLLTRDIINLLCSHLELFRATKAKIKKHYSRSLTIEELDKELKYVLYAENKLHPSLFSAEAEHKVLQHLMDGLMSLTFNPKDLQCSLFLYVVRELLACAVMRPVLNLASPRFINERIESLVISLSKTDKGTTEAEEGSHPKHTESVKVSPDHFSRFLDPSSKGVELVQLKKDKSTANEEKHEMDNPNGSFVSKDPLLSMDACSTRSWSALASESQTGEGKGIQRHRSGGEWGEMLDVLSRRKTEALAPEHFDNMWAKGRNYKRKEGTNPSADQVPEGSFVRISRSVDQSKKFSKQKQDGECKISGFNKQTVANESSSQIEGNNQNHYSHREEYDNEPIHSDEAPSVSSSSYSTEDEENSTVTGLDTPSVRVWDAKNKRNVTNIHHPLETRKVRKKNRHSQRLTRVLSGRKKSGIVSEKVHVWQEVERTSFLLGDGRDILNSSIGNAKHEDSSDDSGAEKFGRILNGSTASSFMSSASLSESYNLTANPSKNSIIADPFLTLSCEVLGANVVKSGSKTFAVYSISVADVNSHSWSIKRRFRHFEELHRHLKEYPEYNLHLPPKHFLSTGLDVPVIQERCKLLDKYLKNLMQLPTVACSIEVWDFLSVDSQTYIFSNPLSIIETLSVNSDDTACEKGKEYQNNAGFVKYPVSSRKENLNSENKEPALRMKHDVMVEGSRINSKSVALSSPKKPEVVRKTLEDSSSESDDVMHKILTSNNNLGKTSNSGGVGLRASSDLHTDTTSDPTLPSEWVPPNLSLPILNLVDVVFQLQDGGWIRRKAFWVAKQVLHLGMGDAFDDWLIEKIQLLRRGSVVASGIRRLEQILWPDGIFTTKHPRRQKATLSRSPSENSSHGQTPSPFSSPKIENMQFSDDTQQKEDLRRAKLVYDLMIDKAPAAVVGLVGHKEYEQCARDLYFFIQSTVVMKQLAYDLLELLLLSAFPELDYVFRALHEEKENFGELRLD